MSYHHGRILLPMAAMADLVSIDAGSGRHLLHRADVCKISGDGSKR